MGILEAGEAGVVQVSWSLQIRDKFTHGAYRWCILWS